MKYLFLLLSVFTLAACGPGKGRIRIEGELANIKQAEFYIFSEDGAFSGFDTIRIVDGEFSYERDLSSQAVLTMLYPNYTQTYIVAEPGKTVRMKGDAAKLSEAEIEGTKENERLTDFRLNNLNRPERDVLLAAGQYIRKNARHLDALAVFRQYYVNAVKPDGAEALVLLDVMRKGRPRDAALQRLDGAKRSFFATAPGQPLPAFEAKTLDGRTVKSTDFKNRVLLVITCAAWQNESHTLLRAALALEKKYKEEPACLVVAADFDEAHTRKAFRTDTLSLPVVSEGAGFDAPLLRRLGLNAVPGNLLVGRDGRIVARDVMPRELDAEVGKLL